MSAQAWRAARELCSYALANPCMLAGECADSRFRAIGRETSLVLTVNAGYE